MNRFRQLLDALAIALLCIASDMVAQEPDFGPIYSEPTTVYFEFGLKIKSGGNSSGILGTVPVPINWPEQSVSVVAENKSDNLRKITFKNMNKEIRQMLLKANRLSAGETAQGSVIIKTEKRNIKKPTDTSKYSFAKKYASRIKQYLKPSPYIESNNKHVKQIAASIELDQSVPAWDQVETIYRWVRENIEYKFDTKIHSCMHALETGLGDCEELSSVFIAICRCKGIPARAVWIPSHTYPEFYLVDETGTGHWFPCQAAGTYQFGEMTESKPILQKGDRFKLPGNKEALRYVQPTLVAKDAAGGLSIEYISREITDPGEIEQLISKSKPR